jgi:Flp pilus assembly protein TadG
MTWRRPTRSDSRSDTRFDRGAAAVELAVVLPLLLLLVFGIIDFGRMLNSQITVSAAAREGARWAAVNQGGIAARVVTASPGLSPAPSTTVVSGCTGGVPGSNARVTVTYPFTFVTPVGAFAAFFGSGIANPVTLTGQGVMRCEV